MAQAVLAGTKGTYILAGNHDLKYHSLQLENESPIGVLLNTKGIVRLRDVEDKAFDFGTEKASGPGMYFIHRLVFPNAKARPVPDAGITAEELLEEFPEASYIFAGDYHNGFIYEQEERVVVVPGTPIRQSADLIDYKPSVFYVSPGTAGKVGIEKIRIDDGEVVADYLEEAAARDDRVAGMLEVLKNEKGYTLDFIENCRRAAKNENLPRAVRDYVMERIEC
jgi:hypothetical protein